MRDEAHIATAFYVLFMACSNFVGVTNGAKLLLRTIFMRPIL
jgi:hypothetical protein